MLSVELPAGSEEHRAQRRTPAPLWSSAAKPGPHAEDLAAWSASIHNVQPSAQDSCLFQLSDKPEQSSLLSQR